MNLVQNFHDVKSEFDIKANGQVTVSIRGSARLLGIDEKSLRKAADFSNKKLSDFLMAQGVDAVRIADFGKEGIPDTALAIIAQYYAFMANRKTPEAQQLCMAFMAIGIRAWVHEQLGWHKNSQQQQLWWNRIALFQKHTSFHKDTGQCSWSWLI